MKSSAICAWHKSICQDCIKSFESFVILDCNTKHGFFQFTLKGKNKPTHLLFGILLQMVQRNFCNQKSNWHLSLWIVKANDGIQDHECFCLGRAWCHHVRPRSSTTNTLLCLIWNMVGRRSNPYSVREGTKDEMGPAYRDFFVCLFIFALLSGSQTGFKRRGRLDGVLLSRHTGPLVFVVGN